jgi:tetratricopeptide (TPR) repeat protein
MDKEVHQLIEIAEIAMQANEFAHAEKKYIDALYLLDDPKSEEYQKVVNKLAKCYAAQENFAGAKECFEELLFYAKKNKDLEKEAEYLHALAVNTRCMEEYDLASLMCQEEITFRLTHFPDDYCGLARSYHEAAVLSLLQRNPMKGKVNLDKAKQYADKSEDEECQAGIMRGLGDYHFTLNELERAQVSYQESYALYMKSKNEEAAVELLARMKRVEDAG